MRQESSIKQTEKSRTGATAPIGASTLGLRKIQTMKRSSNNRSSGLIVEAATMILQREQPLSSQLQADILEYIITSKAHNYSN